MKKYEYVRINGRKFMGSKFEEHRNIIDECAAQGYSYVGCIPVDIADDGLIKEIDLVFEKEI